MCTKLYSTSSDIFYNHLQSEIVWCYHLYKNKKNNQPTFDNTNFRFIDFCSSLRILRYMQRYMIKHIFASYSTDYIHSRNFDRWMISKRIYSLESLLNDAMKKGRNFVRTMAHVDILLTLKALIKLSKQKQKKPKKFNIMVERKVKEAFKRK